MTETDQLKLTPTERRLFDLTADGEIHTKYELLECLEDDMAGYGALKFHVHGLRQKLSVLDQDIVYQNGGKLSGYRRVRRLTVRVD